MLHRFNCCACRLAGLVCMVAVAACLTAAPVRAEENFADVQVKITFTLTDILITNTDTNATRQAQVGLDYDLNNFGINSLEFAGEAGTNPPASVGDANASETVIAAGVDAFHDDVLSFDPGDTIEITMDVFSAATTPGSTFFAQIDSDISLGYTLYDGGFNEQFSFFFDYEATIIGTLDTALPGQTLAFGEGNNIRISEGFADAYEVFPFDPYFELGQFNFAGLLALDDATAEPFVIDIASGVEDVQIQFLSRSLVNATVAIPEPATASLLVAGMMLMLSARRRRA